MTTPDEQTDPRRLRTPRTLRGCGGLFFLVTLCFAAFWGAGLGVFVHILASVEETIEALEDFRPKVGSKLFSADGAELGEFTIETRQLVTLNEMPLHLQKAFIGTEDHTFYEHKGVRPLAFVAAVADSFRTNRIRGASTITQQIVRNIEMTGVSKEVSIERKLREMLVALQLERHYTKDEILEMYLNQIFLGISAYGVEAAAQQYYLKSAADLRVGESALLAGLARSPNNNQPFRHPENARIRRDIVLRQMRDNGFITQDEFDDAVATTIDSVVTPEERKKLADSKAATWAPNKFKAPYFSEEVRRFISHPPAPYEVDITQKDLFEGGLEVYTTLDLRLQNIAEEALLSALDEFDAKKLASLTRRGLEHEFYPVSGALVCLDNRPGYEGYVRALVGGRDFAKKKFNLATQALRQPGSSVKPFVWLAALDNGMTPSDIVVDEEFIRVDMFGREWKPRNFEDSFLGPIPIRKALELSVNIISIKLVDRFGMPLIRSYMRSAGFRQPIGDEVGLTIGLGTSETTVLDQATCYSTLALGGLHVTPTMVTQIKDRDGIVRYDASTFRTLTRVFPEDVSYQITHLLQGVTRLVKRSDVSGREVYYPSGRRTVDFDRPRAGKTGTTNESRSVWFCGFTPQYTCVVWLGYDDNRPLGRGTSYTGGGLASPIWTKFMIGAHEGLPVKDFRVPAGVEFYDIDRGTGLAGGTYREAYIRGTKPPKEMPIFEMPGELEVLRIRSTGAAN